MNNPYDEKIIDITNIVNANQKNNRHKGFDQNENHYPKLTIIKLENKIEKKLSFLYMIIHFLLVYNLLLSIIVFYIAIFMN